jgi:hypothetical protein
MVISNEKFLSVGEYIDNHKWLDFICGCITSFITYWLYSCSVCKKKNLLWWQNILIALAYPISEIFMTMGVGITTYFSILFMIAVPAIFGADMKTTAFVFIFHFICQYLSLEIRNLSAIILSFDFATLLVMTLECYLWLVLFYLYFNFKEKKDNG